MLEKFKACDTKNAPHDNSLYTDAPKSFRLLEIYDLNWADARQTQISAPQKFIAEALDDNGGISQCERLPTLGNDVTRDLKFCLRDGTQGTSGQGISRSQRCMNFEDQRGSATAKEVNCSDLAVDRNGCLAAIRWMVP